MSREDFTSPFRDGLKNSAFWGFFFSYKEKKLPWNTRFLRVPWQFFVWTRSDDTGSIPMLSPGGWTNNNHVNCRNTTKPITLPCGRFMATTGQHIWSRTPQTRLGSFWALLLATFGSTHTRPITLPCGRFMTTKGTTYAIGQATSNCHKQSKCFYITKQINIKVSIYTNLCVFLQHES